MFGRSVTLFKLFGFRVRLHASWAFLAVLIVWTLAVGYFPKIAPGLDTISYWAMGLAGLIGLAFSIIAHEFAHALVARRFDMPIRSITLFIFGGVAEMEDEPTSAKGEFWMAIAGPIMSIILAAALYLLAVLLPGGARLLDGAIVPSEATLILLYLAGINGLLAIFNMIPAFPLDGGRMLRAALWAWKDDILWATRIAARAGSAFGFVLMVLGLWAFVTGSVVGGVWWFIIGVFVQMAAASHLQHHVHRSMLAGVPVSALMRANPITVTPDLRLDRLLIDYFLRYYFREFPVVEGARVIGCVSLEGLRQRSGDALATQSVGDVMQPCGQDKTIPPDADASRALQKMQRSSKSRLFVTRDTELLGIISLRDLLNYLGIRREIEQLNFRDESWATTSRRGCSVPRATEI